MDCCSTLLIFRKQTPAFFFIAVDLPKAGTFTPFPAVFYEAADVLRRITEKKADFMGEFLTFRNPPDQMQYAERQIVCRVASFLKQLAGCMILQIQRQPGWTKDIDQSPVFAEAKRQQPQTFFSKNPVSPAQAEAHCFFILKLTAEKVAGFQTGQCRCAVAHKHFLRHDSPSPYLSPICMYVLPGWLSVQPWNCCGNVLF